MGTFLMIAYTHPIKEITFLLIILHKNNLLSMTNFNIEIIKATKR